MAEGEDSGGMDVPITEELESVDFLLPQIPPDEVSMDAFLMDWLANDSQPGRTIQEPSGREIFQPDPALWETYLPATAGLSSPAFPVLPSQGSQEGPHPLEGYTFQGHRQAASQAKPSAQVSAARASSEQEAPLPGTQPATGRYSLRPRSAVQREGLRESLGSEDDVSVSASDEGEAGLPRRGSGKRMGAMFNVANKGVTTSINAVGRGLAGTMQAVKGAAVGGATGFASGLPRKRSKDPEVIKAKELARNRRAQKAFRERQKMLQSERSQSMRSLQESVGQLAEENSELKRKIESFQKPPPLRGPSGSRLQAQVDPHFGLEQDLSQEEPLTLYVDPENVLELQAEDVKNLTAQDLRDLWKGYVTALSAILEEAKADPTGAAYQQLQELAKEIARLCQVSCKVNVTDWQVFQNHRLTDDSTMPLTAPKAHWHEVLRKMRLSDAQVAEILNERKRAFENLAAILRQRDTLIQLQVDTLASFASLTLEDSDIGCAHGRAKQALQRLIDNLRAEQSVVLQSFCVVQQRVLTPIQKATSIIHAWPYYPLSLELASALAQQQGAPSAADLLNLRATQSWRSSRSPS